MNQSSFSNIASTIDAESPTYGEYFIERYIPPYVSPDAWQQWNGTAGSCPAGFTCTSMGNASLGAFSCDELARLAVDEFGFGGVLAGIWCPEGEEGIQNCPVGEYCPDSVRI